MGSACICAGYKGNQVNAVEGAVELIRAALDRLVPELRGNVVADGHGRANYVRQHEYAARRELIFLGLRTAADTTRHRVRLNPARDTVLADGDAAVLISQTRPDAIAL